MNGPSVTTFCFIYASDFWTFDNTYTQNIAPTQSYLSLHAWTWEFAPSCFVGICNLCSLCLAFPASAGVTLGLNVLLTHVVFFSCSKKPNWIINEICITKKKRILPKFWTHLHRLSSVKSYNYLKSAKCTSPGSNGSALREDLIVYISQGRLDWLNKYVTKYVTTKCVLNV